MIVVATIALGAGSILAWSQAPKLWRHETRIWDGRAPSWWLWGEALFRGWVRSLVIGTAAGTAMVFALGVMLVVQPDLDNPQSSQESQLEVVAIGVALGVWILLTLMLFSVILFNRPKFVVPPHLRNERGAIQLWLNKRSKQRRPRAGVSLAVPR